MKKIIIGIFSMMFFCYIGLSSCFAATISERDDAYYAYVCALTNMIAYDTQIGKEARQKLVDMGWEIDSFRHNDSRAETNFMLIRHLDSIRNQRVLIVVVPGTEKVKDAEVDLRFGKVFFGGNTPEEFKEFAEQKEVKSTDPMVHRGFNDYTTTAFFQPREDTYSGIDLLTQFARQEDAHLFLTGHSLGGAVATILGARLETMGVSSDDYTVLTFGAPAVGNQAFAEKYGATLDLQRFVMGGDPVKSALQVIKAGYTQFGTERRWSLNSNSHKFSHGMSEYLDAAIRNYYDVILGEEKNPQGLIPNANKLLPQQQDRYFFKGEKQNQGVYIAPVQLDLDISIANDTAYMKAAAVDVLQSNFAQVVVGGNDTQSSTGVNDGAKEIFDNCQEAERLGCGTVAILHIKGKPDNKKKYVYQISTETSLYDINGQIIDTMSANMTTDTVTPIEAVLYNMVKTTTTLNKNKQIAQLRKK